MLANERICVEFLHINFYLCYIIFFADAVVYLTSETLTGSEGETERICAAISLNGTLGRDFDVTFAVQDVSTSEYPAHMLTHVDVYCACMHV